MSLLAARACKEQRAVGMGNGALHRDPLVHDPEWFSASLLWVCFGGYGVCRCLEENRTCLSWKFPSLKVVFLRLIDGLVGILAGTSFGSFLLLDASVVLHRFG